MGYAVWRSDCHECNRVKQEHTKAAKRWRESDRNDIWEKRRRRFIIIRGSNKKFAFEWKGTELMSNETLEKLKQEKHIVEKKLTLAKHKEKQLQSELKRLNRSERTHRLCIRAGMLETFLKEPTVLTDDDVMELLAFIFHSEAVQQKLDMLIENRKKMLEMEVANTLSFR